MPIQHSRPSPRSTFDMQSDRIQQAAAQQPWYNKGSQSNRKPLIDFCTNSWRHSDQDRTHSRHVSPGPSAKFRPSLKEISSLRWIKGWRILLPVFVITVWLALGIRMMAGDNHNAIKAFLGTSTSESEPSGEIFGLNQRPQLEDVNQISNLDTALLPSQLQLASKGQQRRLIFIGDIHGCLDELMQLLSKVEYNEARDHIITTGDVVNKGPFSAAVLDFLITTRASCVRGNHDDRILLKAAQDVSSIDQEMISQDREMQLAKSLTPIQLTYLRSCPIILDVGEIPSRGKFVVVHGGLVPSVELANQDPWAVMNMRIIHPVTHVPSKERKLEDHVPWADLWNSEQSYFEQHSTSGEGRKTMLDAHHGITVVYGHDAKRGLQIKTRTKGLDSACVSGHQLTALVISSNSADEIVQVDCKKYT